MKASYIKLIQILAVALVGFSQTACDNAVFSSDGGNNKAGDPTLLAVPNLFFIEDSFERDDIFADMVNNIVYGWRGFVLDGATPVIGFQSNGAGASIPAAGALGPAQDGQRFLLLTGRPNGAAVETTHVITQSYDLSQFNTAVISFNYLTFGLNDADDTVPENLQLQVCRGTLNECGANDDVLSPTGLVSNNWVTIFTNDQLVNDDALNGLNHVAADWRTGLAVVDLNNPEFTGNSATFVMRFVGKMRDGFSAGATGDDNCDCDDHDDDSNSDDDSDSDSDDDDSDDDDNGHHDKVKICHVPPGNPGAAHTIKVSRSALEAHIEKNHNRSSNDPNKDYLGPCKDNDDDRDHDRDCKDKKHKHKKCKKHKDGKHRKCCKCHDGDGEGDGTLVDGIAIDNVRGYATELAIDEIF